MDIRSKSPNLKQKRTLFGWLFVVSVTVFFASSSLFMITPVSKNFESEYDIEKSLTLRAPVPQTQVTVQSITIPNTAIIISIVSLLTSITTFVGFFSTTVLAWRKERRESVSAELEIKKKQLELEKLRLELGKSED